MTDTISLLGLDTNWLPALIGLIGLPILYTTLAIDAHRDYLAFREKLKGNAEDKRRQLTRASDLLQVFQLEWWVIGAFGVLLFTIMACGLLPVASGSADAASVDAATRSPSVNHGGIRPIMSLYGTLLGLAVGFRLLWARLELVRYVTQGDSGRS